MADKLETPVVYIYSSTAINSRETASTTSPYGKTVDCAKFTINNIEHPFYLNDICTVGQEYTLSFWIKSEAAGSITAGGIAFATSSTWAKQAVTFTATATDLTLTFTVTGTYYIYHPQLEFGNKPSDWSPAPEDTTDAIGDLGEDIREEMSDQRTEILQTSEGVFMSALEDYVSTSEYDTFKQTSEARMDIMSDEISMNFETTSSRISDVDGEMQTKFEEIDKHITFSTNGITISSGENDISLELDNTAGIVFRKNGVAFGLWDGVDFYTGNIVVRLNERAQFGNFGFVPRSDGSLSFLKIAETTGFYMALRNYVLTMYNTLSAYSDTTLTIDGVDASFEGTTLTMGG